LPTLTGDLPLLCKSLIFLPSLTLIAFAADLSGTGIANREQLQLHDAAFSVVTFGINIPSRALRHDSLDSGVPGNSGQGKAYLAFSSSAFLFAVVIFCLQIGIFMVLC